ncbi:MAG: glycosyltransferase family 4 protein [Capsulimonadaceae bacterium]|nr:glycosyltransferase family 4 protein [Capsulimonadaceae bacterium]
MRRTPAPPIWNADDPRTPARILLVARPATGGLRAHIIELLRRLDRRAYEPWICAPAEFTADLPHGLPPYRGAVCPVAAKLSPRDLIAALRLRSCIKSAAQIAPPLVHAHGIRAAWVASLAHLTGRFLFVVTLHNMPPDGPIGTTVMRFLHRRADRIICVSDAIAQRIDSPKVVVIPNGVQLDRFDDLDRDASRKELGIAAEQFVVGCIARLAPEKGVDILAEAARALPDVQFIVEGDGGERARIEAIAPPNMRLLGRCESILPLLAASDVIAVPSRSEGQGIVALESLASGRAVIASNTGGLPGMIRHEETGLLVPPENAAALAAAIKRLQGDRPLLASLATQGREYARANGDIDRRTRELEEVYAKLLRAAFGPPRA